MTENWISSKLALMESEQASAFKKEIKRKLVHLSSTWMLVAIYLFDRVYSVWLFALASFAIIGFEYGRRHSRLVRYLMAKYMRAIFRKKELNKNTQSLTGAFFFTLAVFFATLLFPQGIAFTAVAIMIFSDTAAALVGKYVGKMRIGDKTLEGSAAFFTVAMLIMLIAQNKGFIYMNFWAAVAIALVTTLVELYSKRLKIDDNISIVMVCGFLINLAC